MIHLFFLVFAVQGAVAALACITVASCLVTGSPVEAWVARATLRQPLALWALGFVVLVVDGVHSPDWMHMYWTAQAALVALFVGSGGILRAEESLQQPGPGRDRLPPFTFLGLTAMLAAVPFFLVPLHDYYALADHPGHGPVPDLWQILVWGFGGALPDALTPTTAGEVERGLGHLQRWNTVPLGTTLIAAWLWIGYVTIALVGRLVRAPRWRSVFYLLAPPALGIACVVLGATGRGSRAWAFDVRMFDRYASRETGVWKSEAYILESYGPVLSAAAVLALALLLVRRRGRDAPASFRAGSAPRDSTAAS